MPTLPKQWTQTDFESFNALMLSHQLHCLVFILANHLKRDFDSRFKSFKTPLPSSLTINVSPCLVGESVLPLGSWGFLWGVRLRGQVRCFV